MKRKGGKSEKSSAADTPIRPRPDVGEADANHTDLAVSIAHQLEITAQQKQGDERLRLKRAAQALRDRSKWKLKKEWRGFFKLFKSSSGEYIAVPDERLETIERRIRQGMGVSKGQVASLTEALEAILFSACKPQPFVPPHRDQIPLPAMIDDLRTNAIEVHRAADELWRQTVAPCIVFEILQRTFGQSLRAALEVPTEERGKMVAVLKRDFSKALDAFFSESPDDVTNRNKAMVRTASGDLQPFSVLAIHETRLWVESSHELPTKHQLETALRAKYPKQFPCDRTWPNILKEAGLDELAHKVPWK
jgi:hypothetical protein